MRSIFKYCPNCQSANVEFINNHRFKCDECKFVYYHNVASAVALIIKKDNKILFTRRANEPMRGKLDLPGGFVDPKESAESAAKRELWEELHIKNIKKLHYFTSEPNTYIFKNIQYHTCDICYIIDLESHHFTLDLNEIQEIKWIPLREINLKEIGFQSIKKIIKQYLAKELTEKSS